MKKLATLILALIILISLRAQVNRIPVLRSDSTRINIFMSGGNLAWDQFANDFGPGATNFDYFEEVFTAFENAGGNSMRLWVHINGANNPELDGNGYTTGLEESHISDMQRVLDLAYNHKIVLVLSLWSFDMLNHRDNPAKVVAQGEKILTVEKNIQAYIDNALIPMVKAFKDHPAVGAWEIFNEPEGMSNEFGWSHTKHVPMSVIQRFVNRCAGAIHRADPDALVTNGTWAMYTNTDILTGNDKYKNYYSDKELVAKGGDKDGTLDFYQVHYYDWMSDDISVMHHPADHWKLDKAILVGEFFPLDAKGISWKTYYDYLYKNGYAGALAWQWYGEKGSTEPYRTNMVALMKSIRDYKDIEIEPDRNRYPFISSIKNGLFDVNSGTVNNYVDLDDISSDPDGDKLTFSVKSNSNPSLVDVSINDSNGVDLTFTPEKSGAATIVIQAEDPGGLKAIVEFKIVVRESGTGNLALFRTTVYTAHNEKGTSTADPLFATDGDYNTRWSSAYQDPAWYYIDLGAAYKIKQVTLYWEVAYGKRYEIQVSNNASDWTTVYTENSGDGGTDDISFNPVKAQFVRMYGIQRATKWGYSLYEFEVYGTGVDTIPMEGITIRPSTLKLNPGQTFQLLAEYKPQNATNKKTTWSSDNESVATVGPSGLVSAKSLGNAKITATTVDGGFTSISNITVTDKPIPVRYNLTVEVTGPGSVTISPEGGIYDENTSVTLTAVPDSKGVFNGWSGDVSDTSAVIEIIMDGNKTIKATFTTPIAPPHCVSFTPIGLPFEHDGSGEYCWVTSGTIDNINSWNLDYLVVNGTDITNKYTTSLPDAIDGKYYISCGSSVAWGHVEIAGSGNSVETYSLTVNQVTGGKISPESGKYKVGTVVTLTATPDSGYKFDSWIGDANGTKPTTTVTMDAPKKVSAVFKATSLPYFNLTVNTTKGGTVDPTGGKYPLNTKVTLTATPDTGNVFIGWSGDASGSDLTTTIIMDAHKTITAKFQPGGAPCESPSSVTLPYSKNGKGEYCWFTADAISNVNSWNMEVVEVNGVDYTNKWSNSFPKRINGGYYIYYHGKYEWSHFEAAGLKGVDETEFSTVDNVSIYPNPFSELTSMVIDNPDQVNAIEVIDQSGRLVETFGKTSINYRTEIGRNLQSGLYLVNVKTDDDIKIFIIAKH